MKTGMPLVFIGCSMFILGLMLFYLINPGENRNLEFKIKIEDVWDLWELQKGCCNLTGLSIILPKGGNHENVASLDRIDSSRGYIKDNIQWVHKDINRMKWDFPQDKFVKLCFYVANKHGFIN